jgi:hypothetical protein
VGCSPWTPRALRLGVSLLASKSSLCAGCRWSRLPSIDSRECARLVHRFGFTRPWIFLSPEFPLASRRSCFFSLVLGLSPDFVSRRALFLFLLWRRSARLGLSCSSVQSRAARFCSPPATTDAALGACRRQRCVPSEASQQQFSVLA